MLYEVLFAKRSIANTGAEFHLIAREGGRVGAISSQDAHAAARLPNGDIAKLRIYPAQIAYYAVADIFRRGKAPASSPNRRITPLLGRCAR